MQEQVYDFWEVAQRDIWADWMRENTPCVFILPNRPSFTGNGTDAAEYGWFVWSNGIKPVIRVLADTPREERRHWEHVARQAA